ncbi:nitrate- and nitrite sensing domain-containing protein [Streptomyces sp. NPDC090306]|uniref:sensor histidine kinase n=1 Tax=Streptomyces sp. NPDC090306 TaxID=3365961 RepID=UPI003809F82E
MRASPRAARPATAAAHGRTTPAHGSGTPARVPVRGRRAHAGPPADERPADTRVPRPGRPPTSRTGAWRLRPRTVRAKVVCLLMVPVVSLLALWAFATVGTAQDIARLRREQQVDAEIRLPVVDAVTAIQDERAAAVRYATEPSAARSGDLKETAARTDRAVAALRLGGRSTVADSGETPAGAARRLGRFVRSAEDLRPLRTAVLDHRTGWYDAYERYTRTVSDAFAAVGALTAATPQADPGAGTDARVRLELSRAGEALAQEDVALTGARLAGRFDAPRRQVFAGAAGARRAFVEAAAGDLRGDERDAWRDLATSSSFTALTGLENQVLAAEPGTRALAPSVTASWDGPHARVQDAMRGIDAGTDQSMHGRTGLFTRGLLTPSGAAVLFGLVAVAASLVISVDIGRGLVVELVNLRDGALEIARRKLPAAMGRLRAGEEIDIHAEAPAGPPAEDETGQVAEALATVHRAALRAAAERAELAGGISGVFVNLARRSQVLVHRQLNLLDSMERRSDDPDELSDLFRLDHLTTRMRRHAESLIILSGAAPGRAWRRPVPLTNVVRAAVSEIEDYARVEVRELPEAAVVGAAVADLTHLLAELVENAAQFSPPHTRVRITGEHVGNGYAVEVEDRGLGMSREALADANRRIRESETLDLFDSDRLGLFVVSRLAARRDIKVHLRTSPYGGTTAVVLLPTALLHDGAPPERTPAPDPRAGAEPPPSLGPARVVGTAAAQTAVPGAVPGSAPASVLSAPPRTPRPKRPAAQPGVTALRPHRTPEPPEPLRGLPDTAEDLPHRVRQANLAPQLREPRPKETAPDDPHDDLRTPEAVRDRMTAYRAGWARGGGRPPGRGTASRPGGGSDEGEPA